MLKSVTFWEVKKDGGWDDTFTQTGHYFSTARKTVKYYLVLFNFTMQHTLQQITETASCLIASCFFFLLSYIYTIVGLPAEVCRQNHPTQLGILWKFHQFHQTVTVANACEEKDVTCFTAAIVQSAFKFRSNTMVVCIWPCCWFIYCSHNDVWWQIKVHKWYKQQHHSPPFTFTHQILKLYPNKSLCLL